jgi:hypothetical protein
MAVRVAAMARGSGVVQTMAGTVAPNGGQVVVMEESMDSASERAAAPVFVGGTGRSGTTIAAQLIGQSAYYELVPIEVRFHADSGGLPDLVRGRVDVDRFIETMTTRWYWREASRNGPRGIHVVAERPVFEAALARMRETFARNPVAAAGQLVHDLLDPVARRAGKPSWVEMTPPVAGAMASLGQIIPNARFIHMIRDGRDVACSVVPRVWGPNDLPTALKWWADKMIAIGRAEAQVPAKRVLRLRIESLVGPQRDAAYDRLRSFLGIGADPGMRAFFDTSVTSAKARMGRWRKDRDAGEIAEIEKLYKIAIARLRKAGVSVPDVD